MNIMNIAFILSAVAIERLDGRSAHTDLCNVNRLPSI